MKSSYLKLGTGFFIILLLAEITFAQQKNPTTYPYGGVPDISRTELLVTRTEIIEKVPLKFDSRANFEMAQFDSLAYFELAEFNNLANFGGAQFDYLADFSGAQFDSLADFEGAEFRSKITFNSASFNGGSKLNFRGAAMADTADFSFATLKDTLFIGTPRISTSQRYDFMRAYLLPAGQDILTINDAGETLSQEEVRWLVSEGDTALAGLPTKTVRYPGAKIVLFGPVELNMQAEKIEFLALHDSLDYYAKKDIISHLKENSFKGEKFSNARFELDYLFARSTIYQKQSVHFEEYQRYSPVVLAQWLYKATMELGYRPFKLLYWIAAINFLFAVVYLFLPKMRRQVNGYIASAGKDAKNKQASFSDSFINILYFSFMLFFTFRLKQDVLTAFETKEKRIVVFHWLLGFAVYISFLTFSKAGSVLHTLKSLFVG